MSREILAITNYRVSSDEQLKNNSIAKQEKMCLDAVKELGAKHHKAWSGSVSSKKGLNVDRKDLQEMLEECKSNKKIKYAVFDELDRFMRSMLEIGYFFVQFKQLGVQVKFASQPDLNADTATNTLLLMLEAYKAEGSNEERQRKSINGQVNALKEGRYPFAPKPGYMKGAVSGIQEVHPVRGLILGSLLKRIANGLITPSEALVELNASEFMTNHSSYKMDKFRKICTDSFYAGVVEIHSQVDFRNENGLHQPLISLDEHKRLLDIFDKKKKNQTGPRKNGNPKYPLSNITSCKLCEDERIGRYVGFDVTNGKNKSKVYEKYRCRSCNRYLTRSDLHEKIDDYFAERPMDDESRSDLIEALSIVWREQEGQSAQEIARMRHKVKELQLSIASQVEAATDPSNAFIKEDILQSILKKKEEVKDLEADIENLEKIDASDEADFMSFALNFAENISSNFLETSKETRLKCKQLLFPAGFWIGEDNKVYTPEISPIYSLATIEKDTEVSSISHLVRVTRL